MMARRCMWLAIALVALVTSSGIPQQATEETTLGSIRKKMQVLLDFSKDLLAIQQASNESSRELDFDICNNFGAVSDRTYDHLDAVDTFLDLYPLIDGKGGRELARSRIRAQCKYYAKLAESSVDRVNLGIAHAQSPAVTQSGMKLRDEVREIKGMFEKVKLPD